MNSHNVTTPCDSLDVLYQYAIALGDCTSRNMTCTKYDGSSIELDNNYKVLQMDGRLPHRVTFFDGLRFSIIYYKQYDRTYTKSAPLLEPARVV